jgi:hypothetical protein
MTGRKGHVRRALARLRRRALDTRSAWRLARAYRRGDDAAARAETRAVYERAFTAALNRPQAGR